MVEQTYDLNAVFSSLGDPTRRDILYRVGQQGMSVGEVAQCYEFSLAGVAKHLSILERAGLVRKTRHGREQIVTVDPRALAAASDFLSEYTQQWERRLDSLDTYLQERKSQ